MDALMNVVQSILAMGPSVMLPIIIFIVGLVFRVKPTKAITSGITVGIGMIGINLVINLLTTSVGPAAQAMVERFGLNLTIIDAGWPAVAGATWAQPIAGLMILIVLLASNNKEKHIDALLELMDLAGREDYIAKLLNISDPVKAYKKLRSYRMKYWGE